MKCIEFASEMDAFFKITAFLFLWSMKQVTTAPARQPRLSLAAQIPDYFYRGANGTYTFGYDVLDPETGNTQFRTEERYSNGTVAGSYGYIDALGKSRRYDYIADSRGYRVVSNKLGQEQYKASSVGELEPSTEASEVWTRPPKRKNVKKTPKPIERRQFNHVQPPSYYVS